MTVSVSMPRTRVLRSLVAPAAAAAVLALAAPASAHDVVIGGNPANEEVVEEFPEVIELEFSGYVKEDFNTVAISDSDSGEVLFSGPPTIDGRMVSIEVPDDVDPGAGDYNIGFQITSSDGHSTRGMTTFTVAGEPEETTAPESATQETTAQETTAPAADEGASASAGQGPLMWILAGVGVLAVLGVIVMMVARGRHNTQE
ncbi:copper resistance CopC family protein [Corynebacterium sp.]|uniref:copper resistance CopC family protein n=1 Tax=Corynebacterium sp. TaxID=1720 RepID=UPI0026E03B2D|nr:copper resistance CopC family protein [Corynebacterium sp.]MDO5511791.1 copper resistance protein CopC [Corynebacterium sp.]